jgi:predicted small lipoprotein YifL
MKRFLSVLLVILMVLALAACAGNQNANEEQNDAQNNAAQEEEVQEDNGLSDLEQVKLISEDWKTSGHRFALVEEAERGAPCSNCHDGNGFNTQGDEEFNPQHVTGIDCQACHTELGAKLIETGKVELPFLDEPYDAGRGAVCMSCHNGRRNPADLLEESKAGELEKFTYPHYGMAGALLTGKGGMEFPDAEYATSSGHSDLENTCVSCHMPTTEEEYDQHTFTMDEDYIDQTCSQCHSDIENFNLNGSQDEVKEMLGQVEGAVLEATGATEIESYHGGFLFKNENGEEIEDISPEAYAAAYNWKLVSGDGSYGVHNPKYAKSLLQNSYKILTDEELEVD